MDDILEAIDKIEEYIADMPFELFIVENKTKDAVVRNLEIIGEASKNIPEDIKKKYPDVEWRKIIGLRNIVVHDYFGVDYEIIWEIITNELTPFKKKLTNIKLDERTKKTP
ncbi:MAG: DUF86 domain-containing protein [bacterium]